MDAPLVPPTDKKPSMWTSIVAAFLCVPASYAALVPQRHWINHSRLVMFVFLVVLPLSGLSWAHLVSLLIGPREYSMLIAVVAGMFMMCMVGLMDSMLCGALGQRHFTAATFAVFCFRWVFALCAATSLAGGAVLFIMGDQLNRERADQVLNLQEADRLRVGKIHDLVGHETAVGEAKGNVVRAQAELDTMPQTVTTLKSRYETCQTELKNLEDKNSQRLPPLEGAYEKLHSEIQRLQRGGEGIDQVLSELKGKLHEIQSEIGQFKQRVSRKANECQRYSDRAASELLKYKEMASKAVEGARKLEKETVKTAAAAKTAASVQMQALNTSSEQAWSKNLSAQVKAAWTMVSREWWAKFIALVTFIVCLVTELSPMLGKVALHGGGLDQLAEFDEESARQHLVTQMEAMKLQEEAERSVLPENLKELAEITAIRKTAEAVFDEMDRLREGRDRMRQHHPDARDLVNTIYETARNKMRDRYITYARAQANR